MENDFTGVFYFTNASNQDFTALWNNKEYLFPAGTSCPMLIPGEPLENIQEIRKKWAYKLAVREFHKGADFARLNGAKTHLPATYDDKVLQPWIDQCLAPLPKAEAKVKEVKKTKVNTVATKPIDETSFDPKQKFDVEDETTA